MKKIGESALSVERLGGAAGFGSRHLKSRGEVTWETLSESDRAAIDHLFAERSGSGDGNVPGERYRITRRTPHGTKTVIVAFGETPAVLRNSVKDAIV